MSHRGIAGWLLAFLLVGLIVGDYIGSASARKEIAKTGATYYGRNSYICEKRVKVHPPAPAAPEPR